MTNASKSSCGGGGIGTFLLRGCCFGSGQYGLMPLVLCFAVLVGGYFTWESTILSSPTTTTSGTSTNLLKTQHPFGSLTSFRGQASKPLSRDEEIERIIQEQKERYEKAKEEDKPHVHHFNSQGEAYEFNTGHKMEEPPPPPPPPPATKPVTVIVPKDIYEQEYMSFFNTKQIERFGSGKLQYKYDYDHDCTSFHTESSNKLVVPEDEACLVVIKIRTGCIEKQIHRNSHCKTIVVDDLKCIANNTVAKWDARLGYDDIRKYTQNKYIPLGPRYDIWYALQKEMTHPNKKKLEFKLENKPTTFTNHVIVPSSKRQRTYNAIFAKSTNPSRISLASKITQKQKDPKYNPKHGISAYVHLPEDTEQPFLSLTDAASATTRNALKKKHATDDEEKDNNDDDDNDGKHPHMSPIKYANRLLNSVFTLAPSGQNPECFRIYEAIEAGSIPVIVTGDASYHGVGGTCHEAYHRMIESGAPFPILEMWNEWFPYLEKTIQDPNYQQNIDQLQVSVLEWYHTFMTTTVSEFETMFLN